MQSKSVESYPELSSAHRIFSFLFSIFSIPRRMQTRKLANQISVSQMRCESFCFALWCSAPKFCGTSQTIRLTHSAMVEGESYPSKMDEYPENLWSDPAYDCTALLGSTRMYRSCGTWVLASRYKTHSLNRFYHYTTCQPCSGSISEGRIQQWRLTIWRVFENLIFKLPIHSTEIENYSHVSLSFKTYLPTTVNTQSHITRIEILDSRLPPISGNFINRNRQKYIDGRSHQDLSKPIHPLLSRRRKRLILSNMATGMLK